MEFRVYEGSNLETIKKKAVEELSFPEEKLEFTILEERKGSLFGLVGGKHYKVKVAPIQHPIQQGNPSKQAKEILSTILSFIGDFQIELKDRGDELILNVIGQNTGLVIGKEGQTLLALQHLLSKMLSKDGNRGIKLTLDAEGYRDRRKDKILYSATQTAERVKNTGQPSVLHVMSAYDRYIIHNSFQQDHEIYTKSIGEGRNRRVIIIPTQLKGSEDEILRRFSESDS